jgi:hypothetical protein
VMTQLFKIVKSLQSVSGERSLPRAKCSGGDFRARCSNLPARGPVRRVRTGSFAQSSALVAPLDPQRLTQGDPDRSCAGPARARRAIAESLTRRHHPFSHTKVAQILHDQHYSSQGNRRTEEGDDHPGP